MDTTLCYCGRPTVMYQRSASRCAMHVRIEQIIHKAMLDRKVVPTPGDLERMFAGLRDLVCPVCRAAMVMLSSEGRSVVTLRQNRDKTLSLVCRKCNAKAKKRPRKPSKTAVPADRKVCYRCKRELDLTQFYKSRSKPKGVRDECIPCKNEMSRAEMERKGMTVTFHAPPSHLTHFD